MNRTAKTKIVLSLGLNIAIVILTVIGTFWMMTGTVSNGSELLIAPGAGVFRYFTVDAGLLACLSAAVAAVCLLSVLAGKRDSVPEWADTLRLCAGSSLALMALVVLFYLAPQAEDGFSSLYRGPNLIFHCVLPLLMIAEQFLRQTEQPLQFRANLLSPVPVLIYGLCYIVPWLRAGEDKTGHDLYGFLQGASAENAVVLMLLMLLITICLSVLLWCATRNFEKMPLLSGKYRKEASAQEYESVSSREYYQTRVIKLICAIAPAVAMCAAVIFSTLTLTDHFEMPMLNLVFFDMCCLAYLPFALYISDTCIGKNGMAIPSKVKFTKRLLTLLIVLQWNLISYLAPFGDFWAYSFIFAAVSALFLDRRLLLTNEVLLFVSMLVSWSLRGDILLPAKDEYYVTTLILRFASVIIAYALLYIVVLLIENILLKSLDNISDFDPLTHTLTRRKLLRAVETALETYHRIWVPCCIAIFDIDDFKTVNDTYGHITGDDVLREFSRIMYANIQSRDVIFRYGGEEFLILFFCSENYAEASCNRILHELRTYEFPFLPAGEHITCTAGISVSSREMTAEEFIALADKRLYEGKRAGKDRVVTE